MDGLGFVCFNWSALEVSIENLECRAMYLVFFNGCFVYSISCTAPRFGVEEFFFFLMVLMSLSFLSLALLDHWSVALKERVASCSDITADASSRDRRHTARRQSRRRGCDDGDDSGSDVSGQMSASSSVISEKPIWQASNSNQNFQQLTLPSTGT